MKHQDILKRIDSLPTWQQGKTRKLYLDIVEWKKIEAKNALRKRPSRRTSLNNYCSLKGRKYKTFWKWLRKYEKEGIEGLILKYGQHRKGKSIFNEEFTHINYSLLGPARECRDLYGRLKEVFKSKGTSPPSRKTFYRILQDNDLMDLLVEEHKRNGWVRKAGQGVIEIDLKRPLACLGRKQSLMKAVSGGHLFMEMLKQQAIDYAANRLREELKVMI